MIQQSTWDEPRFRVVCVWCGETISLNSTGEVSAMCLECYRDMLFGHFRAEAQDDPELVASER